jgi:hypothetical protein
MKEENKDKFGVLKRTMILTLFLSIIVLSYRYYKQKQFDKYKETFKGEAIGLTMKFKKSGRSRFLMYCFYLDGKIVSKRKALGEDEILNKFYKVKYDLKNPKANCIFLDKELKPDSLTLVKAGFTWTKYYTYDGGMTSRYLESSKWK